MSVTACLRQSTRTFGTVFRMKLVPELRRSVSKSSFCRLVILICIGSHSLWCQINRVQEQLISEYKGRNLVLRNFYSGTDLLYDKHGVLVSGNAPGSWMLAAIEIRSITVAAQGIEIAGNRLGKLYEGGKPNYVKVGKVRIHLPNPTQGLDSKSEPPVSG
jgi:hypothetical protein